MPGDYPRDLKGLWRRPAPSALAPRRAARAADRDELRGGGENSILHGDAGAETFLSEIINAEPFSRPPHEHGVRSTNTAPAPGCGGCCGCSTSTRCRYGLCGGDRAGTLPAIVEPLLKAGHEICSHGYKWINYQRVDEATERAHVARAVEVIKTLTGAAPQGWYTGRTSPNTRRLVVEHGGFLTTPTTTMTIFLFG